MDRTFRAPHGHPPQDLGQFWGQYFTEIPVCTHADCDRVALEIDPFFPYLDDRNRCDRHGLETLASVVPLPS
jgi:hypothetical protein